MEYTIIERNIGRAGTKAALQKKAEILNNKYGEGNWQTGYEINGEFHTRESAIEQIFEPSYFKFLDENTKWVDELIASGGVFNPHALFSKSIDLQAVAVDRYMESRNLSYTGVKLLPIGSYQPKHNKDKIFQMAREKGLTVTDKIIYPPISYALSPFKVPCIIRPEMSIEDFWQSDAKVLAIKNFTSENSQQHDFNQGSFRTLIGDVFELVEDGEVICITTNGEIKANGEAVMGKGFAKQIVDQFRTFDIAQKIAGFLKKYGNRSFFLGSYAFHSIKVNLVTFPTKQHWKDGSDLTLIETSAKQLVEIADKFNFKKVYLPMPGAGAGKLHWSEIQTKLNVLDERFIIISNKSEDFNL